ncbi:MAG: C40 family peptidase [Treponema sp.]|nr:C40 family peptidase [Treponema sp.]
MKFFIENKFFKKRIAAAYRVFLIIIFINSVSLLFPAAPIQKASLGSLSAGAARSKLISAAEAYLGTGYRYGGIDSRGMDCSGLVYASFKDAFKITVPRTAANLYAWAEKIPASELDRGDLVFFTTTGPGITHVGIYAGDGIFIHAPSGGTRTGVVYSRMDESYWHRTFAGAGRALPGDDNPAVAAATAAAGTTPGTPAASASAAPAPAATASYGNPATWTDSTGLFFGLGIEAGIGSLSYDFFGGAGFLAKAGYKGLFGPGFMISLEFRPCWDRYTGSWRFPLALSLGGDVFQVFAGPVAVNGDPQKIFAGTGSANVWFWEFGISAAFKPFQVSKGAASFFFELSCQPQKSIGSTFSIADLASNLRSSIGLRYLWLPAK